MGHSAGLKIVAATGDKVVACSHCVELGNVVEKLVAETRIIVSHIQKAAKRRAKPVQELVEINKEIAEALTTLGKITDDVSESLDPAGPVEKAFATTLKTGGKPMLLMPSAEIMKGVGVNDILQNSIEDTPEYDEPDYMPECLTCDDTGMATNKQGVKIPCKWCNPGGKAVTIPGEHVKCPWCHAVDTVVGACVRCDGCGHVPYDTVFDQAGTCRFCKGKGKIYEGATTGVLVGTFPCDACGGFGKDVSKVNTKAAAMFSVKNKPASATVCSACKGIGKTFLPTKGSVTCLKCDGDGYID